MEIGAPAISFLIDTWEGHLTPPEAVSIADRASRGCDLNIVRAAAELALSCLPHAHALNPNEIQRAILQVMFLCLYIICSRTGYRVECLDLSRRFPEHTDRWLLIQLHESYSVSWQNDCAWTGRMKGICPIFTCRNWGKSQNTLVKLANVMKRHRDIGFSDFVHRPEIS
jgi:hypothetical protein